MSFLGDLPCILQRSSADSTSGYLHPSYFAKLNELPRPLCSPKSGGQTGSNRCVVDQSTQLRAHSPKNVVDQRIRVPSSEHTPQRTLSIRVPSSEHTPQRTLSRQGIRCRTFSSFSKFVAFCNNHDPNVFSDLLLDMILRTEEIDTVTDGMAARLKGDFQFRGNVFLCSNGIGATTPDGFDGIVDKSCLRSDLTRHLT